MSETEEEMNYYCPVCFGILEINRSSSYCKICNIARQGSPEETGIRCEQIPYKSLPKHINKEELPISTDVLKKDLDENAIKEKEYRELFIKVALQTIVRTEDDLGWDQYITERIVCEIITALNKVQKRNTHE